MLLISIFSQHKHRRRLQPTQPGCCWSGVARHEGVPYCNSPARVAPLQVAWSCFGSHNLSKAAWGKLLGDRVTLKVCAGTWPHSTLCLPAAHLGQPGRAACPGGALLRPSCAPCQLVCAAGPLLRAVCAAAAGARANLPTLPLARLQLHRWHPAAGEPPWRAQGGATGCSLRVCQEGGAPRRRRRSALLIIYRAPASPSPPPPCWGCCQSSPLAPFSAIHNSCLPPLADAGALRSLAARHAAGAHNGSRRQRRPGRAAAAAV